MGSTRALQQLRPGLILQQLKSWHPIHRGKKKKKDFQFSEFLHFRIADKGLWVFSTRKSSKR